MCLSGKDPKFCKTDDTVPPILNYKLTSNKLQTPLPIAAANAEALRMQF